MKIILKIGTAAIFDSKKQKIKKNIIKSLARDISKLTKRGNEIIIVSSGAVGCGRKLIKGKNKTGLKQAQASAGQIKLLNKYSKAFSKYNLNIAQFLLTFDDLKDKTKINNIKETYNNLKGQAIPVINENDVTSIEGLSFGDNDVLASKLLLTLNFDTLIILTEVGALIKNKKPILKSNLFSIQDYDTIKIPTKGFGGLKSKLDSAKEITKKGKRCILAKAGDSILKILSKEVSSTEFYLQ